MNKFTYLEKLDRLLSSLPYNERREIMYDYEQHFNESEKEGKSEEETMAALGTPEAIASKYLPSLPAVIPKKSNSNTKKIITKKGNGSVEIFLLTIAAIIFNCIFIVGPYIGLWGVIIAFTAVSIVLIVVGFILLLSFIISVPIAFLSIPIAFFQYPILTICIGIILICIGGLLLIANYYIIRFICFLTYKYVKWLIKLVRGY